jgi:hypothetical protein
MQKATTLWEQLKCSLALGAYMHFNYLKETKKSDNWLKGKK